MCVQKSVGNCESHVREKFNGSFKMQKRAKNIVTVGFDLKLDTSLELSAEVTSSFQSTNGVLWWVVE